MGNPKRKKCSAYLEKIKKGSNIFKMSKRLVQKLLEPTQRSMMELF